MHSVYKCACMQVTGITIQRLLATKKYSVDMLMEVL